MPIEKLGQWELQCEVPACGKMQRIIQKYSEGPPVLTHGYTRRLSADRTVAPLMCHRCSQAAHNAEEGTKVEPPSGLTLLVSVVISGVTYWPLVHGAVLDDGTNTYVCVVNPSTGDLSWAVVPR